MTTLPFSPNIEVWEALKEGRTGLFRDQHIDLRFHDFLIEDKNIYTQYCSFKPKKNDDKAEWVALHPDDFYDDLEKILSYCNDHMKMTDELDDKYHRLQLYLPVVILGGDLYTAEAAKRSINLKKVKSGFYMHFGIRNDQQTLALVAFVTEKHVVKFFEDINEIGYQLKQLFIDTTNKK